MISFARSLIGRVSALLLALLAMHGALYSLLLVLPDAGLLQTSYYGASPRYLEDARDRLGISDSPFEGYLQSLESVATGQLGTSMSSGIEVKALLGAALRESLPIWGTAMLTACIILVLGLLILMRWPRLGGSVDIGVGLLLVPPFLLAVILHMVVRTFGGHSVIDPAVRTLLAGISTGAFFGALLLTQASATMSVLLRTDYARTHRSVGLTEGAVFRRLLRNTRMSMAPHVTRATFSLIAASAFTEYTFDIHGLGHLCVVSTLSSDIPTVLGCGLIFGSALCVATSLERRRGGLR